MSLEPLGPRALYRPGLDPEGDVRRQLSGHSQALVLPVDLLGFRRDVQRLES